MARKLNKAEGILAGGSSGANMVGAMRAAKQLKAGQNCVVLLPDGVRNYLTKFLNDEWMVNKKFLDRLPEAEKLYPKATFDITKVYDPEMQPEEDFQQIFGGWPNIPNLR